MQVSLICRTDCFWASLLVVPTPATENAAKPAVCPVLHLAQCRHLLRSAFQPKSTGHAPWIRPPNQSTGLHHCPKVENNRWSRNRSGRPDSQKRHKMTQKIQRKSKNQLHQAVQLRQNFNRSPPSSPPLIQQPDRNEECFATGGFCKKLTMMEGHSLLKCYQ